MEKSPKDSYSIKQWAEDDRPREKFLKHGGASLSNSELLGILIANGSREKSAVDLAKEILRNADDNLNELGKADLAKLTSVQGIGPAKAITILAALELGRRRHAGELKKIDVVRSSTDIANFLQTQLKDLAHEVFAVVYLNQSNKIIHFEIISSGGITGTVADPRIILRKALENKATSLVLSHNHPSGNLTPSKADTTLTDKIKNAASFMDIRILDHIIVSEAGYYSFADEGLI